MSDATVVTITHDFLTALDLEWLPIVVRCFCHSVPQSVGVSNSGGVHCMLVELFVGWRWIRVKFRRPA
eukprot:14148562-Alexandrium_andersonii.AAC.1